MSLSPHAKGALLTVIGVLIITPDTLLLRLISVDQGTIIFWRGMLSGLTILMGYALVHRRAFPSKIKAMGWPGIYITMVFGTGSILFVVAVMLTTVANVLFIISISPLFSALISRFILRDVIHPRIWIAIFFAIIGIGIIAWGSFNTVSEANLLGDLAALGVALVIAITFTIVHRYKERDLVPAIGFANIVSALFVFAWASPLSVAGSDILWIAIIGLIVVPLSFTLMTIGSRYIPAPEVGLFLLLEAVIGPYWVWLVVHEHPGDLALVGGGVVLATLTILNLMELLSFMKRSRV